MRILILNWRDIKNPTSGGAEILTHEMAKHWVHAGNTVHQFSSKFTGSKKEEIVDGVKIIRSGNADIRSGLSSVHLAAIGFYKKNADNYDIVIDEIHGIPFFSPLYIKKPKVILICEVANELWKQMFGMFFGSIGWAIEKFSLQYLYLNYQFLTISQSTKDDLIKYGIKNDHITVLPMGFHGPKKKVLAPKEKNPTIIFVSRLSKQKGIDVAIESLAKLKSIFPEIRLWIIGRGDEAYVNYLHDRAKSFGVKNAITFYGYVDENKKFELLSRAWIIVQPSRKEGWGLNIIEANAVGTPAIGYNVHGLKETIQNMKTGLLTKENTVDGLSYEIKKILEDKALYNRLSKNSIAWSKTFSWEKTGETSLKVIKNLMKKSV